MIIYVYILKYIVIYCYVLHMYIVSQHKEMVFVRIIIVKENTK